MGLADLVPGVSGGTIAFLFGIYDELLFSIKTVTGKALHLVLRGKIKQAVAVVPFGFLVPLFVGIGFAIISFVHFVTYLLDNHPVVVWSFFFGLVLGSAYVVSKRVQQWNYRRALLFLVGFGLTFFLVGLPGFAINATPFVMLVTGAVAICAMILPGISGSLIMVIMGQYKNVINAVAHRELFLLAFFGFGAVVGLALFVRLLSWLLRVHHSATVAVLIGVMLGSLRKVWPWKDDAIVGAVGNVLPVMDLSLIAAILLMATGLILVLNLEKLGIASDQTLDIDSREFTAEIKQRHE